MQIPLYEDFRQKVEYLSTTDESKTKWIFVALLDRKQNKYTFHRIGGRCGAEIHMGKIYHTNFWKAVLDFDSDTEKDSILNLHEDILDYSDTIDINEWEQIKGYIPTGSINLITNFTPMNFLLAKLAYMWFTNEDIFCCEYGDHML